MINNITFRVIVIFIIVFLIWAAFSAIQLFSAIDKLNDISKVRNTEAIRSVLFNRIMSQEYVDLNTLNQVMHSNWFKKHIENKNYIDHYFENNRAMAKYSYFAIFKDGEYLKHITTEFKQSNKNDELKFFSNYYNNKNIKKSYKQIKCIYGQCFFISSFPVELNNSHYNILFAYKLFNILFDQSIQSKTKLALSYFDGIKFHLYYTDNDNELKNTIYTELYQFNNETKVFDIQLGSEIYSITEIPFTEKFSGILEEDIKLLTVSSSSEDEKIIFDIKTYTFTSILSFSLLMFFVSLFTFIPFTRGLDVLLKAIHSLSSNDEELKTETLNKLSKYKSHRILNDLVESVITLYNSQRIIIEQKVQLLKAETETKQKEQFIREISHDFRNPLNSMLGMTRRILAKPISRTKTINFAQVIYTSGYSLKAMLDNLIDQSKLKHGTVQIKNIQTNLHKLLYSTVNSQNMTLRDECITINLYLEIDLPIFINIDKFQLKRIIENLINNAIKFTDSGFIFVSVSTEANQLIIKVKDSGIGISQDKLHKVFDEFERIDNQTAPGHGIGLSIVKKLITLMNGEISVTSKEQQGTEFCVKLPFTYEKEIETSSQSNTIYYINPKFAKISGNVKENNHFQMLNQLSVISNETGRSLLLLDSEDMIHIQEYQNLCKKLSSLEIIPLLISEQICQFDLSFLLYHCNHCSKMVHNDFANTLNRLSFSMNHLTESFDTSNEQIQEDIKVLIIDDDILNLETMGAFFDDAQVNYEQASHGKEALELLSKRNDFSIIFVDQMMPEMDGFSFFEAYKSSDFYFPEQKVYMLTANTQARQQAIDAGFDDMFEKPFDDDILISVLKNTHIHKKKVQHEEITLDDKVLKKIIKRKPKAALNIIIGFREETPDWLLSLAINEKTGNTTEIKNILHKIKGRAGLVGAMKLAKQCQDMYDKPMDYKELHMSIKLLYNDVLQELESFELENFTQG